MSERPRITFQLPTGRSDAAPSEKGGFTKAMFSAIHGVGQGLKSKLGALGGFFSTEADDDEAPTGGATAQSKELEEEETLDLQTNTIRGTNYELSYRYYAFDDQHEKSYFFTSPLGDPFPSYHSNPDPFFPPRWTSIPGVKLPVESLTAPRIRLAPKELQQRNRVQERLIHEARLQPGAKPKPKVLNLAHQLLGDPYQFGCFQLFIALNSSVEVLNLNDNELEDLSSLRLDHVRRLYLSQNNIASFKHIPPLPNCVELIVTYNFIMSYEGFDTVRFPKLQKLCMYANPLCTDQNYKQKLVKAVPTLKAIDFFDARRIDADD